MKQFESLPETHEGLRLLIDLSNKEIIRLKKIIKKLKTQKILAENKLENINK